MNRQLGKPTNVSFAAAKNVYHSGGYSKSVATIMLKKPLSVDIGASDIAIGISREGIQVVLSAYADYDKNKNVQEIKLQYVSGGCFVGGLPSSIVNIQGCKSIRKTFRNLWNVTSRFSPDPFQAYAMLET